MNKPGSPAAAAAEIQRQHQSVAETVRQNTQRREKETRRQLQRERATINASAQKLNSPNAADNASAVETITKTVLRGTGIAVSDIASPETLARVTSQVLKDPTVVDLGVKGVLDLKVSDEDAKSIPAPVVQRLTKLAK
jgi:hypothetical protein